MLHGVNRVLPDTGKVAQGRGRRSAPPPRPRLAFFCLFFLGLGPEFFFEIDGGPSALVCSCHQCLKFGVIESQDILVGPAKDQLSRLARNAEEPHPLEGTDRLGNGGVAAHAGMTHDSAVRNFNNTTVPLNKRLKHG